MLIASLYIIVCSAKNRVVVRLRRLREPRYLVGAFAGAAYFYFAVFARIRGARRVSGRPGPVPAFPFAAAGFWPLLLGAALLVMAALAWLAPSTSKLLEFSDAETQFLFPAPVSRRQLLLHRLMRSQLGLLFAAMVPAFLIASPGVSGALLGAVWTRLLRGLALWVIFVAGRAYFAGVTLSRARLASKDARTRRIAWIPLAAIVAALAVVVGPLARSFVTVPARSPREAMALFDGVTAAGWPRVVLWPFVSLVGPFFADGPGSYVAALLRALMVTAAVVVWVLWSDEAFQGSGEGPPSRIDTQASKRAPRVRAAGWSLGLTGRTETVFFWKSGMQMLRGTNLVTMVPYVAPAVVFVVIGMTARMSAMGTRGLAGALATGALIVAAFCALLGPQTSRGDLRGDLRHLEVLKTWPVKSAAVIRGEMLWPTVTLTLCAWFGLVCATVFSAAAFPGLTLAVRLSLSAAAIVLAPALIAAQLTVHNAVAVLFPAWVSTGTQRPRGLDAMGQRLILFGGVILALVVMIGPGAIAGGIIAFAFYRMIGAASLLPAAVICLAVVAVEIGLVTELLGGAYDRVDLSEVERPD